MTLAIFSLTGMDADAVLSTENAGTGSLHLAGCVGVEGGFSIMIVS